MNNSEQVQKIVLRFIDGEKRLFHKLKELYETSKNELNKDNIYEAYLIEYFKDEENIPLLLSLKKQIQIANKPDKKMRANFTKRRAS